MKYELQRSFAAGELSELVHMRNDFGDMYDSGLSLLRNMRADARGPAVSREGMKHITQFTDSNARVATVSRTDNTFFTLIFLDLELKVIRDIDNVFIETYVSPWTSDQVDDIQIISVPTGDVIYLFHPNVQTQKLEVQASGSDSQEFLSNDTFIVPAGITEMSFCVCGGGGGGGGGFGTIFNNSGGGGGGSGVVKNTETTVPTETLTITVGAGGISGSSGGDGGDGSQSIISGGFGTRTSNGGNGGIGGDVGGAGASGGGNGGTGDNASTDGSNCSAVCSGPDTSGGNAGASTGGGGGGGGGFGDGGNGGASGGSPTPPSVPANRGSGGGGGGTPGLGSSNGAAGSSGKVIVFWGLGDSFTLTPVTFTSPPVSWGSQNWPAAAFYYQGRLWMGGAPSDSEEFVASVIGSPEDLTTGVTPEDAIVETLQEFGGIKWIMGTKELIMGTINTEYLMSSDSKILVAGEISADKQSSYGSVSIQPVIIGDQIIYISADSRRVNAMNYDWGKNNWSSIDLTFFSEHITKGLIKNASWSQHPNRLLWMVLEDGTFGSLSYEPNNNALGWSSYDTNGVVKSLAVGFDGIESILILAVERQTGIIEIEKFSISYKLDSWIEISTSTVYGDMWYIEGFDHLEGMEVQILIDDINHPVRIVGAESEDGEGDGALGRIYLEFTGTNHIAGLQYIPQLISIPSSKEYEEGNDFMHKKTYSEIAVKLLDSRRPVINGRDTFERSPTTPQGDPELPKTELLIVGNNGWDQDALIDISQPLPYHLKIAAIGGKYKANKL